MQASADETAPSRTYYTLWVFLLTFVSSAYFFNGATAAPNSRFDLVYSLVEDHSFRIDRFVNAQHLDWSRFDGHYYSNKGPGAAFLGAAVYAPLYGVERLLGGDPKNESPLIALNAYVINIFASSLWLAIGACALFSLLLKTGRVGPSEGAWIAAIYILATLVWPYGSSLWGHTTTAGLICLAFERLAPFESATRRRALFSGLAAGFASITEYTAGLAVLLLCSALIIRKRKAEAAWFGLGVLPALVLLLAYQNACFGSPWTTSYRYINPAIANFWSFPQWRIGLKLLFSPYRGVFFYCPILLASVAGIAVRKNDFKLGAELLCCAAFALGLFLVNSSFSGWHGGSCAGPRYLIPALPLLGLPLVCVPRKGWARVVFAGLAAISLVNMLVLVSVTTFVRQERTSPLATVYRGFFSGDLGVPLETVRSGQWQPPSPHFCAFNLGQLAGLTGLASLLPLAVFVVMMAMVLRRISTIDFRRAFEESNIR